MARDSKSASFCLLPGEIVVEIFGKLDIETLCICERVSRRFYQISSQFTFFFNAPFRHWKANKREFRQDVYSYFVLKRPCNRRRKFHNLVYELIESMKKFTIPKSMTKFTRCGFMTKFTRLRALHIVLPLSSFKDLPFVKWKVSIASNKIYSFMFVSPTSIHNTKESSYINGNDDHEKVDYWFHNEIAKNCMEDAFVRYMMLVGFARECPFLEKITITDRRERGRVSLSGAKLCEVIKSSTTPLKVDEFRHKVSRCHIPSLYLPVSGFVMKGVKLILYEDVHLPSGYTRYDRTINDEDDFEGKEKAAYSEAVMEIFNKHKDKIISLW